MNRTVSCTTPTAFCHWAAVFLLVYGTGLTAMALWPQLGGFQGTVLLVALGVACLVSFARDRTYHCALTGPLFLAAALAVGFHEAGRISLEPELVWGVVLIGVGLASLLETRFAEPQRQQD